MNIPNQRKPEDTGLFISLEGMDGAGKTTQMLQLKRHLESQGMTVCMTREPGGTRISEKIRELILSPAHGEMHPWTEALLYAAARAQHVAEVIMPALERDEVVLCDRFVDSSLAYQGAGRKLGIEAVFRINQPAIMNRLPDLTFWFDLTPEESFHRKSGADPADRLEQQAAAFYQTIYQTYRQLAQDNPGRYVVVDATKSIPWIQQLLRCETDKRIHQLTHHPLPLTPEEE
ncbi:MAG: dTMP kinase [Bacillota bacterium]|nr:dTMP kinase [Bacillota bacterium]